VQRLLEKGADVAAASNEGWTPLKSASSNGHVDVVRLLLEKGADVTAASNEGWSILHSASSNGHVDIVKLLLEHDADIAAKDTIGWTPLFHASKNGDEATIELLLATNRVDVDLVDYYNSTPLLITARIGYRDVAAFLLTNSHALNVEDNFSRTLL